MRQDGEVILTLKCEIDTVILTALSQLYVIQVALCALVCGSGLCDRADGQLCRDLGKHRGSQVFVKLLKEKLQYFHQNFDGHSLF